MGSWIEGSDAPDKCRAEDSNLVLGEYGWMGFKALGLDQNQEQDLEAHGRP